VNAGVAPPPHTLVNRYCVRGVVFADTALHVGARPGAGDMSERPIARDAWGQPYIPGSTLKGALRMTLEQLVPALGLIGVKSCGLQAGSRVDCVSVHDELAKELASTPPDSKDAFLREHLCATCALFGSVAAAGKITVADLALVEGWPGRAELREGVAVDRDTERALDRRRYDLEVLPAGSPFQCGIHAENLSDANLGLLAMALLELVHGHVALGGGRSRGMGRCHLQVEAVERIRFDANYRAEALGYLRDGAMPALDNPLDFLRERLDALLAA
jgi:CRISPR-associated protein Csm3